MTAALFGGFALPAMLYLPSDRPGTLSLAQAVLYRGAGLDVVWPSLLAIAAIAAAFFTASLLMFRRSIAAQG